jgi:hypothetical protein
MARCERTGAWITSEDSTLKDAVEKHNGKNWDAISELVPGRKRIQCNKRWHNVLHPKSDGTIKHTGAWAAVEDSTLKDAVEKHNGADWAAISKMVPGRTKEQCWDNTLHRKSDETITRTGKWTTVEDSALKDAVEKQNGKDWAAISKMVLGRTKQQCWKRWHSALHCKSDETTARAGKWTTEEDSTLKDAVQKHNGNNWAAISELVQGRTEK